MLIAVVRSKQRKYPGELGWIRYENEYTVQWATQKRTHIISQDTAREIMVIHDDVTLGWIME